MRTPPILTTRLAVAAAAGCIALAVVVVAAADMTSQAETQLPPSAFGLPSRLVTRIVTPPVFDIVGVGLGRPGVDPSLDKLVCTVLNLGDRPLLASFSFHNSDGNRQIGGSVTLNPGHFAADVDTNTFIEGEYCVVELAGAVDRDTVRVTLQTYFAYRSGDVRQTFPGPAFEGR